LPLAFPQILFLPFAVFWPLLYLPTPTCAEPYLQFLRLLCLLCVEGLGFVFPVQSIFSLNPP
jgi:hypothetical protein